LREARQGTQDDQGEDEDFHAMVSGRAIPHWAGQTIPWPTIFEVIEASKGVLIGDEVAIWTAKDGSRNSPADGA
jgi:hypothetical protein